MALDYTPLNQLIQNQEQQPDATNNIQNINTYGAIGELIGEGLQTFVDPQNINAKDAGEYIRGYARNWAKQNNMDYKDLVEQYPIIKMAESGVPIKKDHQGKIMYQNQDGKWVDDFGGMQGYTKDNDGNVMWSPFGSKTISGKLVDSDGKDISRESSADPFEAAFDKDWRENLFSGEGMSYRAPKTRLGALFSKDKYRPQGTGRYVNKDAYQAYQDNPQGALADYIDLLNKQYGSPVVTKNDPRGFSLQEDGVTEEKKGIWDLIFDSPYEDEDAVDYDDLIIQSGGTKPYGSD